MFYYVWFCNPTLWSFGNIRISFRSSQIFRFWFISLISKDHVLIWPPVSSEKSLSTGNLSGYSARYRFSKLSFLIESTSVIICHKNMILWFAVVFLEITGSLYFLKTSCQIPNCKITIVSLSVLSNKNFGLSLLKVLSLQKTLYLGVQCELHAYFPFYQTILKIYVLRVDFYIINIFIH